MQIFILKPLYCFIIFCFITSCNSDTNNNSKNLSIGPPPKFKTIGELSQKAHTAKLFLYVPINNERSPIIEHGTTSTFVEIVVDSFTRVLSNERKKVLENIIQKSDSTKPIFGADCFFPHHAIVFYDKQKTIIGNISICFSCSGYEVSQEGIHDYYLNLEGLKTFFNEEGIPTPYDYQYYFDLINRK